MTDILADLYREHLATVRERVDRALSETGFDQIVVFAGSERMVFLDDMPYPFKVNAHFKYWVPVTDNPNCFLVYRAGGRPVVVFFQPVDYWHKPAETPRDFWVEHVDLRFAGDLASAREHMPREGRTAFIGEWETLFDDWNLGEKNPKPLLDRLHFERAWKTEYEIECMRRANAKAARAHVAAEEAFRQGGSEYEIHLAYLRAAGHTERELPYGNIIALNENAAVLHYQHQSQKRFEGEALRSFLIDAGASVNGYASDITRTYSRERDEFQMLIDAMDEAQLELCDAVRPGVDYKDIHLLAHRKVAAMLRHFDLVVMDEDQMVEKGVTSAFFPHGIGHYIGLQVHDAGGFLRDREGETIPKPEGHPFLRLTRKIEKDQVFTIEPGLYFIDSLLAELRGREEGNRVNWDRVEAFRPYGGVRIEDDVRVTEDGHENLTRTQWPG